MAFKMIFATDNAAFEDDPVYEVARILRDTADKLEAGRDASHFQTILDINGNDVGRYKLAEGPIT